MAEIQVPVKLQIQNLQSLVTELQNKLSNLKVGSTGFKNIQNIIQSIRGEIDKLSVQTAKPFVDASQFTKAERSVDKLEDQITKVSIAISRLKFGDLELTDAQKADIKGFEDSINNIKDKIKTVKDAAKDAFLKTEVGQEWLSINPEAATKSLSQITGVIEREVDKQRQELDKLKASAADYQKAIDQNNRVREFLDKSGDDPLSKLNLGEQYDKIFQETKKGTRYTPNGRNLLADWLSSQLKLDDSTISQIINKNVTAANVTGKLKEVLSSQLTADKDLHAKQDANNVALQEKQAQYNQLTATLNAAAAAQQGITVAEQAAKAELTSTEAAAANYRDRLVDIARSGANVQSTTNAMKSQLDGFRNTLEQASGSFLRLQRTQQSFNQMKIAVVNFMGFNQVLNLTKRAVREAVNHIKELDTVMNKISIVTDMSTGDLWGQVDQYSKMAQAFGTTIKGAYEVSQIYYQQGLGTNDVLTLTNETLKLAKVSGLDYATTTDYMTTALRGFKMEMSEASTVVDVYSNLAAHTAVSSEELAVAMSKTASSMESVGSTFEETSAMIGTMVAVTRESAVNIGSALKSIAARYGEMKKDPLSIIDSEGEEVSFNKVDAALQSVGISLKTTEGQFRSFTDVILELSEKWDQLESTQQRYIATQFAGNRQQSRFLALVSNKDLLKANIGFAEESEDTGTLQALKALDSIESKLNQVQVAYQQFYTTMGVENVWKGLLDGATNVINTLNSLPKVFGKIPVGAIAVIYDVISLIKSAALSGLQAVATAVVDALHNASSKTEEAAQKNAENGRTWSQKYAEGIKSGIGGIRSAASEAVAEAEKAQRELSQQKATNRFNSINQLTTTASKVVAYSENIMNNPAATHAEEIAAMDKMQMLAESARNLNIPIPQLTGDLSQMGQMLMGALNPALSSAKQEMENAGLEALSFKDKMQAGKEGIKQFAAGNMTLISQLNGIASALTTVSVLFNTTSQNGRVAAGSFMALSGAIRIVSGLLTALKTGMSASVWGALALGIVSVINGISTAIESPEERLERLVKEAEELNNKAKEAKANYRTLDTSIKKINELEKKRYESAESAEEYQTAVENLTNEFPELIAGFDATGQVIFDVIDAENLLATARQKSAKAAYEASEAELKAAQEELNQTNIPKVDINASQVQTLSNEESLKNKAPYTSSASHIPSDATEWAYNLLLNYGEDYGFGPNSGDMIFAKSYNNNKDYSQRILSQFLFRFAQDAQEFGDTRFDFLSNPDFKTTITSIYGETVDALDLDKVYDYVTNLNEMEVSLSEEEENIINHVSDETETLLKLNELITQFNTSTDSFVKNKIQLAIREEMGKLSEETYQKYNNINESLDKFSEAYKNFFDQNDKVEQQLEKTIANWINYTINSKNAFEYITDGSELITIVNKQIRSIVDNSYYSDWEAAKLAFSKDMPDIIEATNDFWNSLTVDDQSKLNKVLSQHTKYSVEDITSLFSFDPLLEEALKSSRATYEEGIKQGIQKSLTQSGIESDSELYNSLLSNIDTALESDLINSFLRTYNIYKEKGMTALADQYISEAQKLFSAIESIPDVETRNTAMETLIENGVLTAEGLIKTQNNFKNNDILKDIDLNPLISSINTNIPLAISSTISDYLESWKDSSKKLTSALSEGIEGYEIDNLINELQALGITDVTTADFERNGNKYILSLTKWNEYWNTTNDILNQQMSLWQDRLNSATTAFQNHDISIELLDSFGIAIKPEWLDDNDILQYKENSEEIDKALSEAINSTKQSFFSLLNYRRMFAAEILSSQLKKGNYSSLKANLSLSKNQTEWERILQLAQGENFTDTELKDKNIYDTVKGVQSSFSQFISDVISKGYDNIHWEEYEYISKDNLKVNFSSYVDFVKEYAKYTSSTIDEVNDLMVQAYKKDSEKTSGAAKDALKDVTFYKEGLAYASLDTINELAKIFDIPVQNIIGQYNELLGGYQVNLDNIDLSTIDDFAQLVKESINGIIKNIIGFASSAISGKLSQQDKLNFNAQLDALGLSTIGDIDFVETVDGLKMSQAAATNLYNELKHVDRIQAQLLFNDLNKSLQETNEHYKSISDIANRIKEIESIPSNARTNQYEQELALAKEIYAVRSTTEDSSFSFMSNKIPGAQNNPINYFNNWAKAIHTFNDALKTQGTYTRNGETFESGFVDYDFWYNLVTEMNNIARVSGTKISFAGKELNGDLTTAAELIEAGAASLVATDTGEIKVALSGMSLNFESGADAFSGGVTEGIQELAKSQSEMLDGMIQLLETVVAMEKLGDITGENDTIDITDLFPDIAWKEGEKRAIDNEKAINWINNELLTASDDSAIGKFINSVLVNNQKLRDILTDAVNQSEGINVETAEALSALLNSLWQMSQSNEYDQDSLFASLQQVAKTSDLNMTIPMGDSTLLIEHGAIIVQTKEGKFETPDGTSYGSSAEAFAASMMTALGIDVKGNSYHFDAETGTAVGTLELGSTIFTVTRDSNGKVTYKGKNGVTGASLEEYIHNYAVKDVDHGARATVEEIELQLQLEYGVKQLDSFTYKSIKDDIKQQLEEALASGDQTKVDAVIEANPILSQLKGQTGEEIAKLLHLDNINVSVENTEALNAINVIEEELKKIEDNTITIKADISQVKTAIDEAKEYASKTKALQAIDLGGNVLPGQIKENVKTAKSSKALQSVEAGGNNVPGVINYNITYAEEHPAKQRVEASGNGVVQAVGNIGLATGNAQARGTLMGELGPELVVSKGRYFVVGQAGPEMVNLADDAIVFNHLQTESLLKKGMSKGRGKAVTNERNAVSFATGNVNGGPAKASASAALAALRQLKAQWDALAGLSAKDLAGKGGGGGGGGGDPKAFLKDLERWYDWLQQIAQLEKEITLEEAKRTEYQSHMVARGKEYFTSQLASLELLQEQAVVQKSLNDSQEEYFQKRLKEINQQSAFSALYGFSESGQLYYKDVYADNKSAFEWLSDLVGRNEVTGEANYTAEEQYNKLVAAGFGFAMEYDSSGNKIKHEGTDWYNTALQAFWDKIDRDKEEMQSLHDSVEDGKKKLLDLENAQNEILHEIEDNQIEVEQKVLKAIEEARQREIDELKDTKEAIENSAKEFTDGLNKQLDKERQMRDNQASADELATLQRRLSILQRSGGSASEIRDLQQQINDKQYDKYFDMQEQQIQAIQDSSDAQIERLDNQIELMEEALAYEKENGLLWTDVDEILKKSSEDIVSFIQGNTSEYWSKSTTELQKVLREDLFEVDRFKQFQATVEDGIEALIMKFGTEEQKKALADKKRAEAEVENGANTSDNTNTTTTTNKETKNKGWRIQGFSQQYATKKAAEQARDDAYRRLSTQANALSISGNSVEATKKNALAQKYKNAKVVQYATGGYDYTTGLAMLHGTKSRPESIFNAEQTRILREQFLSNRPDSVISLLKDYREAYHGLSTNAYDSIQNNSNATTIEHAEVNLNVDKLANDYDAKRAANTIMDEMLRIASKTSANNSVRR